MALLSFPSSRTQSYTDLSRQADSHDTAQVANGNSFSLATRNTFSLTPSFSFDTRNVSYTDTRSLAMTTDHGAVNGGMQTAQTAIHSVGQVATTAISANTAIARSAMENYRHLFETSLDAMKTSNRESQESQRTVEIQYQCQIFRIMSQLPPEEAVKVAKMMEEFLTRSLGAMDEQRRLIETENQNRNRSREARIDLAQRSIRELSSKNEHYAKYATLLSLAIIAFGYSLTATNPSLGIVLGTTALYYTLPHLNSWVGKFQNKQKWLNICYLALTQLKAAPNLSVYQAVKEQLHSDPTITDQMRSSSNAVLSRLSTDPVTGDPTERIPHLPSQLHSLLAVVEQGALPLLKA